MNNFAFVFPGQGSQTLGMLDEWARTFPIVAETLQEAEQALGRDLGRIIRDGPADELSATINTQPAMLLIDVAIWRAWNACGGARPCVLAGHSLGEYAALVAADSLDFGDAMRLVNARAQFMQEAVPAGQGAMAAVIGMDDEAVMQLCATQAQGQVLEAVNFNAIGQVVVAGDVEAVQRLLANAKGAGARMAKSIPVSVPAHCALMKPAAERLREMLHGVAWREAQIPVLHNVDASRHSADEIAEILERQIAKPVQWVRTLQHMADEYAIVAGYECGPGSVLCGLAKRSIKKVAFKSLAQPSDFQAALEAASIQES